MAKPVLYGIRNCDTVKKARAWLELAAASPTISTITNAGIDAARLARLDAGNSAGRRY